MSVNKVILIGNLGKDPELRFTSTGSAVARFPIATSEVWNDRDGNKQERTEWHNIAVWGKQAEIAEKYLKKGSAVFVEGRIRSREYTDKENIQRRAYDIVCDRFSMLDRKPEGAVGGGAAAAEADIASDDAIVDDLPF